MTATKPDREGYSHATCPECGWRGWTDTIPDCDCWCGKCGNLVEDCDCTDDDFAEGCEHCRVKSEARTCENCGDTVIVIDCGHYQQPAYISEDEAGRMLCRGCDDRYCEGCGDPLDECSCPRFCADGAP